MNPGQPYIGRIAPSPTGAQHLGNARTYLVAWLLAKVNQGELLLRIEDLDTPRTKAGATEQIFEDLRWLGIDWSPTRIEADIYGSGKSAGDSCMKETLPDQFSIHDQLQEYVVQSERTERHLCILERLKAVELVYPCTCSRKEIEESSSAPHESQAGGLSESTSDSAAQLSPLDGMVYPGTCADRCVIDAERLDREGKKYAWRFRFKPGLYQWLDTFAGEQRLEPKVELGDFVVARNYGPPAYQLAVVIDDHDSGVNQVVRGDDLIYSTYRQLAIYDALEWKAPSWFHVPLVVGPDGKRLAKRHGDTRIVSLKNAGMTSRELLGRLAHSLGIISEPDAIDIVELGRMVCAQPELLRRIPREPVQIPLGSYSQIT